MNKLITEILVYINTFIIIFIIVFPKIWIKYFLKKRLFSFEIAFVKKNELLNKIISVLSELENLKDDNFEDPQISQKLEAKYNELKKTKREVKIYCSEKCNKFLQNYLSSENGYQFLMSLLLTEDYETKKAELIRIIKNEI